MSIEWVDRTGELREPEDYEEAARFYAGKIVQVAVTAPSDVIHAVVAREALLLVAEFARLMKAKKTSGPEGRG